MLWTSCAGARNTPARGTAGLAPLKPHGRKRVLAGASAGTRNSTPRSTPAQRLTVSSKPMGPVDRPAAALARMSERLQRPLHLDAVASFVVLNQRESSHLFVDVWWTSDRRDMDAGTLCGSSAGSRRYVSLAGVSAPGGFRRSGSRAASLSTPGNRRRSPWCHIPCRPQPSTVPLAGARPGAGARARARTVRAGFACGVRWERMSAINERLVEEHTE